MESGLHNFDLRSPITLKDTLVSYFGISYQLLCVSTALRGVSGLPPPPWDFRCGGIGGGGDVHAPYFSYWRIEAGSHFGQKEQTKFDVYETRLAPPLTQRWKER
jgi:hypothetical protein